MTDWQIIEQYLLPAVRRAEEFERKTRGSSGGQPGAVGRRTSEPDYEPGTPEHRRQMIAAYTGTMGMKLDAAERLYDSQLAQWRTTDQGS